MVTKKSTPNKGPRSTPQEHQDILRFIEQSIEQTNEKPPPPHVLIYAIRNIIQPSLITSQIRDLVDLLANLEFYRKHAIAQARAAEVWNSYYKSNKADPQDIVLLSDNEEAAIQRIGSNEREKSYRDGYIALILRCARLDLYDLWPSTDSRQLCIRLNEYYPSFNKLDPLKSPRIFHQDLSVEETKQLALSGKETIQLLTEAEEWNEKRTAYWKQKGLPEDSIYEESEFFSYTRDYAATFPRPDVRLVDDIEWYIGKVEAMVRTLEGLFSEK